MIRFVITYLFMIMLYEINAQSHLPIDRIRKLAENAYNCEDSIAIFNNEIKSERFQDAAIIKAYRGIAKAMTAKLYFWPWDKLNALNDGLSFINSAIILEPENTEIYLLKYFVLDNLPSILGYSDEEDETISKIYDLVFNKKIPLDSWVLTRVLKSLQKENVLTNDEIHKIKYRIEIM